MASNRSPAQPALLAAATAALVAASALGGCGLPGASAPGPPQAASVPVIGYLSPGTSGPLSPSLDVFLQGLAELGYVDGQTVHVESRFLGDTSQSLAEVAAELVLLKPDVIVALGAARVQAVKEVTDTIPIVMIEVPDPVRLGLVASLARPGANVTGLSTAAPLSAKRLEHLKEAVPGISRVAVLSTPGWAVPSSSAGAQWRDVQEAASALGIEIFVAEAAGGSDPDETRAAVRRAVELAAEQGAQALYPLSDAVFDVTEDVLAETALELRLPAIYRRPRFAELGGFMAFGHGTLDSVRRAAVYVDKILKGASPSELPVERPTRFDLVINSTTAQALGLMIPDSVLATATVIR